MIKKYLVSDFKGQELRKKPLFFISLGILFLIFALIGHHYDIAYKNWIQGDNFLRKSQGINEFFDIVRFLGHFWLLILIAIIIGAMGRLKTCYKIITTFVIMSILVWSLKIGVHRERPNHLDHYSFPSGDTGVATSLLVSIASDIPAITPLSVVGVAGVAFLRNYDNYHYLSDVLGGIGIALIALGIAIFIKAKNFFLIKKIKSRHLFILSILMTIAFYIKKGHDGVDNRIIITLLMPTLLSVMIAKYISGYQKAKMGKLTFKKRLQELDKGLSLNSVFLETILVILPIIIGIIFVWLIKINLNVKFALIGILVLALICIIRRWKLSNKGKVFEEMYLIPTSFIVAIIFLVPVIIKLIR